MYNLMMMRNLRRHFTVHTFAMNGSAQQAGTPPLDPEGSTLPQQLPPQLTMFMLVLS